VLELLILFYNQQRKRKGKVNESMYLSAGTNIILIQHYIDPSGTKLKSFN